MSSRGRAWKKHKRNLSNAYWLSLTRKIRAQEELAVLKTGKGHASPGQELNLRIGCLYGNLVWREREYLQCL